MSYINYDKSGKSEIYSNVSGKDKVLDKSVDELNRSPRDNITEIKIN